ncbi:hypothetical protein [Kordiimonas laminariae]|uniref:hypothetical protein n=1 Tax=Kordiimonas laminariae TaxID=2917717 RepID=UPI001FF6E146|nr:hypothetical protein [Kordiimonas laminariae]MCK0068534.1 hypothetical protein [Kordiimonas laminariae]
MILKLFDKMHLSASPQKLLLILGVSVTLGACVGKDGAIQVATQVEHTSANAKLAVEQLKKNHEQQVAAHIKTRETLRSLLEGRLNEENKQAVEPLKQIKATALAKIDTLYFETITAVRADKKTALQLLDQQLDKEMQELQHRANALEQLSLAAREKQKKFPNDKDVALEVKDADAKYMAAAAAYLDIRLTAYERGIKALEAAEEEALEKLKGKRQEIYAKIDAKYVKALEDMPVLTKEDIDLGPDPTVPEGYDLVLTSQEAISNGAVQIKRQLESSGFGKNSFFQLGLRSFGQGLIAGAFSSKSGAVSADDLKTSGKDLLGAVKEELADDLDDVEETARSVFSDFKSDALDALQKKVKESIEPVVDNVIKQPAAL